MQADFHAVISIHALREEGDKDREPERDRLEISIHALREEGDTKPSQSSGRHMYFYPRPPRGGRRCMERSGACQWSAFLSTPSARRATLQNNCCEVSIMNFYPRPPRGGRRQARRSGAGCTAISIHALREEGDQDALQKHVLSQISIHALREEGDQDALQKHVLSQISIHALREEGDSRGISCPVSKMMISIHALREEGD